MIIDTFIREYIQLPTESDNYADSHPDPSLCNTVCVSGSPPNELNPGLTVRLTSAESGSSPKKIKPRIVAGGV
jgi:hypothetical protein